MNTFEIKYQGDLRTTATHLDSGSKISTDAPKDNHGLGESFFTNRFGMFCFS
jgi:hypothetical protein